MTGHVVDADGAEQQADAGHQQRARQRGRRHVGKEGEPEHQKRGIFRWPEAQRECGERWRDEGEHDDAERAGDPRADRRDAERSARASFLRHGIAVDARHHRGGFARDPHQDRSGRAAILRAVIDAGQHHHRLGGVEPEGRRQQDADPGERPDARKHAHDGSDEAAKERVPQHARLQRDRETQHEAVEGSHP